MSDALNPWPLELERLLRYLRGVLLAGAILLLLPFVLMYAAVQRVRTGYADTPLVSDRSLPLMLVLSAAVYQAAILVARAAA
jgi:hypothetical protein